MIDVLLNAVKILVSEDARKSASSVIELVHRSPEWQKDICVLEARVSHSASEQAYLLGYLAVEKMKALGYAEGPVNAFQYCFNEIVVNGFEHGCGQGRNARIAIIVDVTLGYVALTVMNSHGMKFDLQQSLDQQVAKLSLNPALRRGRGLLTVYDSADAIFGLENREGVKAVFYKQVVELKIYNVGGLAIICVLAGEVNPSVNRRIMSAAQENASNSLIVWLPGLPSTQVLSNMLDLYSIYRNLGRPMVVLLDRGWGDHSFNLNLLPQSMIAHTWEDALRKIGRSDLRKRVARLVGE